MQQYNYIWDINSRPFKAIQDGKKEFELRCNNKYEDFDYSEVRKDDVVLLKDELSDQTITIVIQEIYWYKGANEFYTEHGIGHSSSKPKSVNQAVANLMKLSSFRDGLETNGLFAFKFAIISSP